MKELTYPFDSSYILKNKKKIKKTLEDNQYATEKKIAVLGGSTTNDIIKCLELFLLDYRIKPIFYESEYNKFYEDAVFGNIELDEFNPDIHEAIGRVEEEVEKETLKQVYLKGYKLKERVIRNAKVMVSVPKN